MANERVSALGTEVFTPDVTDYEDLDSNSLGSRKINPFHKSGNVRNMLSPRGGLSGDGSNTNGFAFSTLINQSIGTDAFSIATMFQVPSSNPGANIGVLALGAANIAGGFSGNDFYLEVTSGGVLQVLLRNAANSNAFAANVTQNLVTAWGGKTVLVVVTRSGSTLIIYINGISYAFTTAGGNDTNDFSQTISSAYFKIGNSGAGRVFIGKIYSASLYYLAVSAANALEIMELGGAVPESLKWGAQQVFWNYSSLGVGAIDGKGVPVIGGGTPTVQSGARTGGAGSFFLRVTSGGNVGIGFYAPAGATIILSFWIRADAANSGSTGCRFVNRNSGVGSGSDLGIGNPNISAIDTTWRNITGTYTVGSTPVGSMLFTNLNGGGLSYIEIDDFSLKITGAILHLPMDDGFSFLLKDISTNKFHAVSPSTFSLQHIVPQNRPHHIRGTTNTNGNQQMGGQVLIPANSQITRIRARAQINTPSITIGSFSGGTDIAASVALSTTWKDLTIALTGGICSSDTSIWIGSNSTDVVEIDITCEPLSP